MRCWRMMFLRTPSAVPEHDGCSLLGPRGRPTARKRTAYRRHCPSPSRQSRARLACADGYCRRAVLCSVGPCPASPSGCSVASVRLRSFLHLLDDFVVGASAAPCSPCISPTGLRPASEGPDRAGFPCLPLPASGFGARSHLAGLWPGLQSDRCRIVSWVRSPDWCIRAVRAPVPAPLGCAAALSGCWLRAARQPVVAGSQHAADGTALSSRHSHGAKPLAVALRVAPESPLRGVPIAGRSPHAGEPGTHPVGVTVAEPAAQPPPKGGSRRSHCTRGRARRGVACLHAGVDRDGVPLPPWPTPGSAGLDLTLRSRVPPEG